MRLFMPRFFIEDFSSVSANALTLVVQVLRREPTSSSGSRKNPLMLCKEMPRWGCLAHRAHDSGVRLSQK